MHVETRGNLQVLPGYVVKKLDAAFAQKLRHENHIHVSTNESRLSVTTNPCAPAISSVEEPMSLSLILNHKVEEQTRTIKCIRFEEMNAA